MSSAADVVRVLTERGETVAFCESLTAGLASASLADVPGASVVLRGALVTYATDLKASLAGVSTSVLDTEGPVSGDTARHMALGAQRVCAADWGLSLTGVAGPEIQDNHPVGEVWIGIAPPSGKAMAVRARSRNPKENRFALVEGYRKPVHVLAGTRSQIRHASVEAAFQLLLAAAGTLGTKSTS